MTPIRTTSSAAGEPIKVGEITMAIAVTPDGKTAYVPNAVSGTVT